MFFLGSIIGGIVGSVFSAGSAAVASGAAMASTAASTVLTTAAEAATALAAEGTAAVSQIPVVGNSIAQAAKAVGAAVGEASTTLAGSAGLSTSTAKSIGAIASGTTTAQINKQMLKPYNEIKDEVSGFAELKVNLRVLGDLANGKMDLATVQDIAKHYKDDLIKDTVDNMLSEQLQDVAKLRDMKEQVQEVFNQSNTYAKHIKHTRRCWKRSTNRGFVRSRENTLKGAYSKLLKSEGMDTAKLDKVSSILMYTADKTKLEAAILEAVGAGDAQAIKAKMQILNDIRDGKLSKAEMTDLIMSKINEPEFRSLRGNIELCAAIEYGRVPKEGLSAIIATAMGVKGIL